MAGGSGEGLGLGVMALNDTKAGMEGLDKESISKVDGESCQTLFEIDPQVIEEASRGSKFYAKKQADQAKVFHQAEQMVASLASFSAAELASARADADLLIEKLRGSRILNKVEVFHIILYKNLECPISITQYSFKGNSACGHGHVLCSGRDEGPAGACRQADGCWWNGNAEHIKL